MLQGFWLKWCNGGDGDSVGVSGRGSADNGGW